MASKIKVKLILELRAALMSQREISRTRKMSQHSVGDDCMIGDKLSVTYDDIRDKSDEETYRLFYPDKHTAESLYKIPDYDYVHTELKKMGVNLKLWWNEYKDSCFQNHSISLGYTKFCEGYSLPNDKTLARANTSIYRHPNYLHQRKLKVIKVASKMIELE